MAHCDIQFFAPYKYSYLLTYLITVVYNSQK